MAEKIVEIFAYFPSKNSEQRLMLWFIQKRRKYIWLVQQSSEKDLLV